MDITKYISFPNGTYLYMYPDGNVSVSPLQPLCNPAPVDYLSWVVYVVLLVAALYILFKSHP